MQYLFVVCEKLYIWSDCRFSQLAKWGAGCAGGGE